MVGFLKASLRANAQVAFMKGAKPVTAQLVPSRPSAALRAVQTIVRTGVVSRGYSWLFAGLIPPWVWGGQSVQVDTEVGPMTLPTTDRSAASLLCFGHASEQRESHLVRALVAESLVMLDIGAHYGWYMRLMAGSSLRGHVFAFEPDPETYAYLEANAAGIANTSPLALAVGTTTSETTLWRAPSRNLSSTVRRVGSPLSVKTISVDDLCSERSLAVVDFIKCDVEGAELDVVHGAQNLLQSERPPIWMLEVVDPFLREVAHSADDILREFQQSQTSIRLYSQDDRGEPVQIERLADRRHGNNIFVVPSARYREFDRAARELQQSW
jgi:FkbM family methyltransferase